MNQKIKSMAEEARVMDRMMRRSDGYYLSREEDIEKFAKLIVRECMDVVRDINQEYDGGSTVVNAADEIKQHFGIE